MENQLQLLLIEQYKMLAIIIAFIVEKVRRMVKHFAHLRASSRLPRAQFPTQPKALQDRRCLVLHTSAVVEVVTEDTTKRVGVWSSIMACMLKKNSSRLCTKMKLKDYSIRKEERNGIVGIRRANQKP